MNQAEDQPAVNTTDNDNVNDHHNNDQNPVDTATATEPSAWNAAYDHNSQKWYYYNSITGERSWDSPPEWVPTAATDTASPQNDNPQEQAANQQLIKPAGYYYIDAYGTTQGPFSKEHLTAWRGALPMDLRLWWEDEKQAADADTPDDDEKKTEKETTELAKILGDDDLLSKWRELNPDLSSAKGCNAPTAEAFQIDQQKDTYTSLAEAALAGLPETDEAVQLARAAISSGQGLHEVVAWSHDASAEYTVTARHMGKMGRIQASDAVDNSLYAEMGSWVDPRQMEEQLAKAANRKKRALTGQELKALKERKREMKDKKMRAWLQD